jgi:hypothetical protein
VVLTNWHRIVSCWHALEASQLADVLGLGSDPHTTESVVIAGLLVAAQVVKL